MSMVSPTPAGQGSQMTALGRRTSARQGLRRPPSRSQMAATAATTTTTASAGAITRRSATTAAATAAASTHDAQYATLHDSSDDEMPIPMKLSALTKALLGDGAAASEEMAAAAAMAASSGTLGLPGPTTRRRSALNRSTSSNPSTADDALQLSAERLAVVRPTRRHVRTSSSAFSSSRPTSPPSSQPRTQDSSPARRKRVVRLSATAAGTGLGQGQAPPPLRRSLSASKRWGAAANHHESEVPAAAAAPTATATAVAATVSTSAPVDDAPVPPAGVNTPASSVRRVQIAVGSSGRSSRVRLSTSSMALRPPSQARDHSDSEAGHDEAPATASRAQSSGSGSASRYGSSGALSNGSREADAQALPGSMRIKRVGKALGGGFLSGPARRGRRRQSDEDGEGHSPGGGLEGREGREGRDVATGSPVSAKNMLAPRTSPRSPVAVDLPAAAAAAVPTRREVRVTSPPHMPAQHDQENAPPLSVHVPKPLRMAERDRARLAALAAVEAKVSTAALAAVTTAGSPERKVLASISRNTPRRTAAAAPVPAPPPKMSVLETATATAGAAATAQANKKPRILLKVNGRSYQRVDCIGRGGSAKVYKVTAENGKMFAMKRVALENADKTTIRGYLGEIDLLRQLSGVDRVIQLFDCEMNKEKQMLSLLMELGEMDLNSLLRVRQNPESARLDAVFVRFYWKEMLECLQAVHAHDIVHSDLKPANFVLVQGRLKLIDFGIANAIQTDQTVNVHRETQIGTPNYMSPESLMDAQQYALTAHHNGGRGGGGGVFLPGHKAPKLMKLGKPSDVWSLGCILYQMVYGLPPFGHIQNQMARCQAIITWSHEITFPARGLGGVAVPAALLATMQRCLNREQQLRPTCADLLAADDAFLYPEVAVAKAAAAKAALPDDCMPVSEELLGRIIQSVVARCRERMPSEGEALAAWPAAYWASVRRAVEE